MNEQTEVQVTALDLSQVACGEGVKLKDGVVVGLSLDEVDLEGSSFRVNLHLSLPSQEVSDADSFSECFDDCFSLCGLFGEAATVTLAISEGGDLYEKLDEIIRERVRQDYPGKCSVTFEFDDDDDVGCTLKIGEQEEELYIPQSDAGAYFDLTPPEDEDEDEDEDEAPDDDEDENGGE